MNNINNISLVQFCRAKIVFEEHIIKIIKWYLIVSFVLSAMVETYFIFTRDVYFSGILSSFTILLIFMPTTVFFIAHCRRLIKNYKLKAEGKADEREKVTYWLISKKFFHLMVLFAMYILLSSVLLLVLSLII